MLNKLPPEALKVAMQEGISAWGEYGSIHHTLYIQPIKTMRRCRCGCKRKRTHSMMANGVALSSGCEISIYRTLKKINDSKGGQS